MRKDDNLNFLNSITEIRIKFVLMPKCLYLLHEEPIWFSNFKIVRLKNSEDKRKSNRYIINS